MRVLVLILVLVAVPAFCAEQWRGFHGAEYEGRCDFSALPLHWSPSLNVVWKTAIPGRGHSSPIVSGDSAYVTTTYERSRVSAGETTWGYTTFALIGLCTVAGVMLAMRSPMGGQQRKCHIWLYLRSFLFAQVFVSVAAVVLFGRRLLDWDDQAGRFVPTSVIVMLACLTLIVLSVPWKRRQANVVGDPGDAERYRSVTSRRVLAGSLGCVVAVAPFALLLCRAADYRIPDSYVLHDRFRPDVGWLWVGLYIGLAFLVVAVCLRRSIRGSVTEWVLWQPVFIVAALSLGVVHFAGVGFAGKPKEFIRAVVCLDRSSGKVQWTCEGPTSHARAQSRVVTHASATPVIEGTHIYGYFGEDGLMCASSDGTLVWKRTEPMFRCKFGVGTSPVVKNGILIVVSDVKESEELGSSIMAFDCGSGTPLWRTGRRSHPKFAAYCTPLIKVFGGRQTVVVHGWYDVNGYDLTTGEELWSCPLAQDGHHLVASLVSDAERLYVAGPKGVVAMELTKLGTANDPVAWRRPLPGEKSATPVVVDGLLFLVTESGVAFCLDARNGEILWRERLKGRYFSSVISAAGEVLFTNESGLTTVVAADREFRELAKNNLGEGTYATIAPCGGQLFARTIGHVYCIGEGR